MRLLVSIVALQALSASATAPEKDGDLKEILANHILFKDQSFFKIDGTKEEFGEVVKLVDNYFTDSAAHVPVAKQVKLLQELIEFKTSEDGKKLYAQAFQAIRHADKTSVIPGTFKACTDAGGAEGDMDVSLGYKPCVKNGDRIPAFTITDVETMAAQAVYSEFLIEKMKQYASDNDLLQQCAVVSDNTDGPSGKKWGALKEYLVAKEVAATACSTEAKAEVAVAVSTAIAEASDKELNELHLQFIKKHRKKADLEDWAAGECREAALKTTVAALVAAKTLGKCTPTGDKVPPSLEEILALQTYRSDEQFEATLPWPTMIFGACAGALITFAAFHALSKRVATTEE